MADRKLTYFRHLMNTTFFTEGHDGLEDADRDLAVDIGVIGIISGLVATQHAPTPDLTIDLTGPGTSYDQAGRRCFVPTATSGLDCSQDEDGNPTAVTTPGNERWCSVQVRFDRTLAVPEVDGNGATVYTDQDESFELAVVRAGEFASGTGTRPALPADGRLVCDFRLLYGTTQIFNAEIYTDRRQDFQIYSAGQIPVSSGGWSFLNGAATDDVQAVFDFIDARILYLDASREMTENLVPDTAGRDLGSSGNEWDLFLETLTPSATATVDGNLIPKTTGNDLGTTTGPKRWSLYADLVNLDGNLVMTAASRVAADLIPDAGTESLGSPTLRWDVNFNTATCYTSILASADGKTIGAAGARFNAFLNAITYYGNIPSTFVFSAAKTVTLFIPVNDFVETAGETNWIWNSTVEYLINSLSGKTLYIYFQPLHGVEIDQMRIRWLQSTGTTMTAQIEKYDVDNSPTNVGSSKTIGGAGAARWDTIDTAIGETVDLSTYGYRVKVVTASAAAHNLYKLEISYKVTDILTAALGHV